jgi:hypothetical protein
MDLSINDIVEFQGKKCHDRTPLLLNDKLGGNIYFEDTEGTNEPHYEGFNDRFLLIFDDGFKWNS